MDDLISEDAQKGRDGGRKDNEAEGNIVFDIGSHNVRCGFAGDDQPEAVFSSNSQHAGGGQNGDIVSPGGEVADWDGYLALLERALRFVGLEDNVRTAAGNAGNGGGNARGFVASDTEWDVSLRDRCVLCVVPLHATNGFKDRLLELVFEQLNATAAYLSDAPLLSLYAHGRTTGLSCVWGAGSLQAKAIFEGYTMPDAAGTAARIDFGGRNLAERLRERLAVRSVCGEDARWGPVNLAGDDGSANLLFEQAARCGSLDEVGLGGDMSRSNSREQPGGVRRAGAMHPLVPGRTPIDPHPPRRRPVAGEDARHRCFTLPDGRQVRLSAAERAQMAEPMFCDEDGCDTPAGSPRGFADVVTGVLSRCPIDTRHDVSCNVVVGGGMSIVPGFAARARAEVRAALPHEKYANSHSVAPRIVVDRDWIGVNSAWVGGSIIGSLGCFRDMWIPNRKYE
jgi:Actin